MAQALRPYCQAYKRLPVRDVMNETKINFKFSFVFKAYLLRQDFGLDFCLEKYENTSAIRIFLDASQAIFLVKDREYGSHHDPKSVPAKDKRLRVLSLWPILSVTYG